MEFCSYDRRGDTDEIDLEGLCIDCSISWDGRTENAA